MINLNQLDKCDSCDNIATMSQSPLGNPDELKLCDECFKKHKNTNA